MEGTQYLVTVETLGKKMLRYKRLQSLRLLGAFLVLLTVLPGVIP